MQIFLLFAVLISPCYSQSAFLCLLSLFTAFLIAVFMLCPPFAYIFYSSFSTHSYIPPFGALILWPSFPSSSILLKTSPVFPRCCLPPPLRQCWIFTWTLVGVCMRTDWWWVRSSVVPAVCLACPCCRPPIGPSLPVTWQRICLWVMWP